MSEACAFLSLGVFLLYLVRMNSLSLWLHDATFVATNMVSGAGCIYSAYDLLAHGLSPLGVIAPIMAGLYLLRSRDAYREITRPADLDYVKVGTRWRR